MSEREQGEGLADMGSALVNAMEESRTRGRFEYTVGHYGKILAGLNDASIEPLLYAMYCAGRMHAMEDAGAMLTDMDETATLVLARAMGAAATASGMTAADVHAAKERLHRELEREQAAALDKEVVR